MGFRSFYNMFLQSLSRKFHACGNLSSFLFPQGVEQLVKPVLFLARGGGQSRNLLRTIPVDVVEGVVRFARVV
jgi:hypothetical protein